MRRLEIACFALIAVMLPFVAFLAVTDLRMQQQLNDRPSQIVVTTISPPVNWGTELLRRMKGPRASNRE